MILTTVAIVAQAAPSPSPAPSASADPKAAAVTADAKAWFTQLRQGQLVAGDTLTDQMKADPLTFIYALDSAGRIAGLLFRHAQ
jgi:hypothetical protein